MSTGAATLELGPGERRDIWLEEAFYAVTEGALAAPNALQRALFPRLMTQDTGLLIPTGPCAGRLEAIVIPSIVGMRLDAAAHRLFIIGPDGSPLDDYLYRLHVYVRSLVVADGTPRTLWLEEPERSPIARKYLPDGSFLNGASDHPFNDDVDIIVMPFSHFRALFFNTGGVHGVPETLGFDLDAAEAMAPRGLFYFDEAHGSIHEQQGEFVRMVEFLFAQDLDVVVGGSSLPAAALDELSFLDTFKLPDAQLQPLRRLQYHQTSAEEVIAVMERLVRSVYFQNSRVILTLNDPADDRLPNSYLRLSQSYPSNVFLYRTRASRAERGQVYAQLRELEKEGEGYLLIVDGPALEVSDLDATYLVTEPCSPLSLVRRSGRCNRRGENPDALIHVVGDASSYTDPALPDQIKESAFISALKHASEPVVFDAEAWKQLT